MRRAAEINSYARPRHLSLVQQTEPVRQVDKQVRMEKIMDEVLIGMVAGILVINIINQAGKAWGWW